MRKTLKIVGFLVFLFFFATSLELHADDDVGTAAEAHCSVTCCPSHHLGPQVSAAWIVSRPPLQRSFASEAIDDPSTSIPLSVFHPPKSAQS